MSRRSLSKESGAIQHSQKPLARPYRSSYTTYLFEHWPPRMKFTFFAQRGASDAYCRGALLRAEKTDGHLSSR